MSQQQRADSMRRRWRALPVAGLLLLHAGLLGFGATRHSPTLDEPTHLTAGVYFWQFGRFDLDRGDPPLTGLVAALPVLAARPATDWSSVPNTYTVAKQFVIANQPRIGRLVMLGRWACISFSVLGGYICFRWACRLYGTVGGLAALSVWCFSPLALAHGQLLTGDMPATALGIAAFYLYWRWLKRPSWGGAMMAGAVMGMAELAKFVWLMLFGLWPALWVVWRLLGGAREADKSIVSANVFGAESHQPAEEWTSPRRPHEAEAPPTEPIFRGVFREAGQLVLMAVLSVYVINLGYAFEKPFQPLGQFEVGRRLLQRSGFGVDGAAPGPGSAAHWLESAPVPLPENYVAGIGEVLEVCDLQNATYLRRRWSENGFWYYYAYAYLVKMPLGALGLLAIAGVMFVCGARRLMKTGIGAATHGGSAQEGMRDVAEPVPVSRSPWRTEVVLGLSALAVLGFVSASDAPQADRYALPLLPFLVILTGKAGSLLQSGGAAVRAGVAAVLCWSVLSSLWVYPHSLAYFNEAAGGPLRGHAHLIGAGIDWGQDFFYLKDWQDRHPAARPLGMTWQYYIFDMRTFEIACTDVPPGLVARRQYRPADMVRLGPQPGWYAINVGALHARSQAYAYFFCFEPVARAGYSIYIYHITTEEANRVRRDLGMPELATWLQDEREGDGGGRRKDVQGSRAGRSQ